MWKLYNIFTRKEYKQTCGDCPPVPQNLVGKMGKNRTYECMIKFERTESQ